MRTSLFVLPLLLAACGGSVDSGSSIDNQNNNSNNQNPKTTLPTRTITGSFDLTFTKVTATPTFSAGFTPATTPPSQGANARLDVASDSVTSVTLTSRWGAPAIFPASITAKQVALDATTGDGTVSASFSGDSSGLYITDRWTTITLGRTADGGFDGTFTATGSEEMFEGDEGFENTLTATGTIAADTTAPEIRADKVPTDGFLPWVPTHVQFAEPPNALEQDVLSLDVGGIVTGDATSLRATLLLRSWGATNANIAAKSFQDLAGNASQASTMPIKYLDVGTAKPAFTFDDTSSPVAFYGVPAGAITQLGTDANCESGGCMKITTTSSLECSNPQMGFAGVLQQKPGHANTLHVRYRMFVGVDPSSSGGIGVQPEGNSLNVSAAIPGETATGASVGFAIADLKTVPATYGFTQATDWKTVDVPVDSASQAGFAIQLQPSSCGGGPVFNANAKVILVDSITID